MRIVTAILLTCIPSLSCIAQEFEAPQTLVGFLKPGLQIGIRAIQNSDRVTIAIYSKPDFEVAIDARHLKPDELASKHRPSQQPSSIYSHNDGTPYVDICSGRLDYACASA